MRFIIILGILFSVNSFAGGITWEAQQELDCQSEGSASGCSQEAGGCVDSFDDYIVIQNNEEASDNTIEAPVVNDRILVCPNNSSNY